MAMMAGMGALRAQPTKPVIRPTKKLQNFNWRRILLLPPDAPNKKHTIWDDIDKEIKEDQKKKQGENKEEKGKGL